MAKSIEDYFQEIEDASGGADRPERWYRDQVRKVLPARINEGMTRKFILTGNKTTRPTYGGMQLFSYLPKHEETLPYYDIFPLVIPIKRLNDGFLGINFHYLSIPLRLKLLEKVQPRAKEGIQMGWTRVARLRYIKPCIKRYLKSHVGSRFLKIEENDFAVACMLPIHTFKKAPYRSVHAQSRKMR